jgi:hypothetical protein
MATTATPNQNRPRRRSQQPRASAPVRADRAAGDEGNDHEYDLLTAALIGVTIGASVTYLLRRGPSGRRPVSPVVDGIGRGAMWAGRKAAKNGRRGARWAAERGEELWDRVPRDQIRDQVTDYVGRAREAIDDLVESELHDLRRAIRRQRKRLGV